MRVNLLGEMPGLEKGIDGLKILIGATPRSGTQYITSLLRSCGILMGHEKVRENGGVCYKRISNVALGFKSWDGHIWHQTRDPIKVIPSLTSILRKSHILKLATACNLSEHLVPDSILNIEIPEWLRGEWGDGVYNNKLLRERIRLMAYLWFHFNKDVIAKIAQWRYRIENIKEVWGEMCDRIGIRFDFPELPVNCENKRGSEHAILYCNTFPNILTWEQLEDIDKNITKDIKELGEEYGYGIS